MRIRRHRMLAAIPMNHNLGLLIRIPRPLPPLLLLLLLLLRHNRPLPPALPQRHPRRRGRHAVTQWRLLLHGFVDRHKRRIRVSFSPCISSAAHNLLTSYAFGHDGNFGVDASGVGVPTCGNEEGEVHEQDDEADDSADEDDDAFAVDVRWSSRAAGEAFAEGGGGGEGGSGVAHGAIWKDGVGGAVGVGLSERVFV